MAEVESVSSCRADSGAEQNGRSGGRNLLVEQLRTLQATEQKNPHFNRVTSIVTENGKQPRTKGQTGEQTVANQIKQHQIKQGTNSRILQLQNTKEEGDSPTDSPTLQH
ncbi:hypothetical protein AKJ16_DCAP20914 [Drosera capensis]